MTNENLDYYRRRAEDELAAAEHANDPAIAQIHREMAQRYRAQLSRDDEHMNGSSVPAQPTGGAFAESGPVPA